MEAVITRSARNSELAVAKDKRAFLTYPADGLAACALEETEDGIVLLFESEGLEAAAEIAKKSNEEQLRFLINCAALSELYAEYEFALSPENLMADINLRPQALMRDVRREGGAEFLPRYKALIGCVLQKKYKYEDYINGGQDLYKKHKLLSEVAKQESVEGVKDLLTGEYRRAARKTQETKKLVSKRNALYSRIAIPVLAAALIAAAFFLWKAQFRDIPNKDGLLKANTAYIAGDYIGVQQSLRDYDLTGLSSETKYFLSRSYVITEALTDAQKENILPGLTLKTDPVIFDYWISLGRLDFAGAIDIAQRLGDDELLLFAYLKYEVVVKNDTTMTGDAKTALLNDLSGKISGLQKSRDEAAASGS